MPSGSAARVLLCAAVACFAPALCADEPQFCVGGTVLNAVTGEPLRRAAVSLPQAATLTDAAGIFRFCQLPAGAYYANAEKPGFASAGSRVVIGPSRDDMVLRLQPLSVISGKVVDAAGEPLADVLIQALSILGTDGHRHVRVVSAVVTDDRGLYRLPDLPAGRYCLRAAGWGSDAPASGVSEAFAPVYYGGAAEAASAAPVTVEPGQNLRAGFSVDLRAAYAIRGTIGGFSTLLPAKIELLGTSEEPVSAHTTLDASTGAFEIRGVVPGAYVLRATQEEGERRSRGGLAIQVGADVKGAVVPLAGGAAVRGIVRMAADSTALAPQSPNCAIKLSPAEAWLSSESGPETDTGPAGDFEIDGVLPGRYRLRMDCADGYIAAARFGAADLLANAGLQISPRAALPPIEATLATDGATLDVSPSAEGEPGPAWVVLWPDSGNELNARFAHLSRKVTFSGVAPGDYQAFAWTGPPEAFEYANPEARRAWGDRAVSLHLDARDRQSITIKIARGEDP